MNIDLAAEVVAALRSSSGRDALREAIAPVIADEVRKALAERAERLEPLADILGLKGDSARKKVARSPELRALGVQVGRRVLFKRSLVEAHLAAKATR